MGAFSEETYCIDNASKDVVAWILVLVVLVAVWIGHLIKLRYLIGYLIVWRKLNSDCFTAPKSPPRIAPASTLPPLLCWFWFSFSWFRFGRPKMSPRLKRTEDQDCEQSLQKKVKTHIDTGREPRSWQGGLDTSLLALNKAPIGGTLFQASPIWFPQFEALFLQPSEKSVCYVVTGPSYPLVLQASLISNCCTR